jgi:hypothetical protein
MRLSAPVIASALILGCQNKNEDQHTSVKDTTSLENTTQVPEVTEESAFPDVGSKYIKIVPTMQAEFSDANTVHCSNIEYLWNEVMQRADNKIEGNYITKILSGSKTWQNSIDTSKLVLAFGKTENVYESIIAQYKTKYDLDKKDLVMQGETFWAYTDKLISYKYAEPFDEQRLLFLGTEVSAFGFNSGFASTFVKDHFKDQFDILYFDYDGEFVVKLKPANTSDEIILVMLNKKGTFLEMFKSATRLIKKGIEKKKQNPYVYNLNAEDELLIPVVRFKASRNYSELKGLNFSSRYGAIGSFDQAINFHFDRKGVVMEANVEAYDSVGMPQKPKLLHFYKPYYLFIKEADSPYPYFNLWVSDTHILERKNFKE